MKNTFAKVIADKLKSLGFKHAFGIPGTHNLELFRALQDVGIELVPAYHEQGLGYAADAYARINEGPALVVTTTGPGITNLISALATSLAASVPVLAIAPGLPDRVDGKNQGWLHDLPSQINLLASLVKSHRAKNVTDAINFIDGVAKSWQNERPVPAYLEVSLEDIGETVEHEFILTENSGDMPTSVSTEIAEEINTATDMLIKAIKPLIIVGRGGASTALTSEIKKLAEAIAAPVASTANAKGVLDENHVLAAGVSLRLPAFKDYLKDSDALLVVGSDLGPSEFWGQVEFNPENVIRIDVDNQKIEANVTPNVALKGRAENILPELCNNLLQKTDGETKQVSPETISFLEVLEQQKTNYGAQYKKFHEHIQEVFEGQDIAIAGDSSQATYFGTASFWKAKKPNRFLYPAGYGTLGYALPAAIGASLTEQADRVIAVTGEGALMFSFQEFFTMTHLELPIITVIFINGGYQEILDGMEGLEIDPVGVQFPAPDFKAFGESIGVETHVINSDKQEELEFRQILEAVSAKAGPSIIAIKM